ncbi:conserved hypothetical protein [Prochlorococcus marinus str. MIT 9312]|uniref:PII interaction protein X n=1 Tax=Prochlorococcus marinus (strain MIT 9312) TaxID=74546 RepID=Q31CE5_PROM9|nr:PII-interacting protein PipX family protein [Prochlorococcus marinus]ABB49450.1 conserved hypothetical protein [Prochlorococcus marinus str. MIT 9312]
MSSERYLNHPTFGMLYQVFLGNDGRDIYATLYAQKMFFLVEIRQREVFFEVIPYLDARNQAELNLQRARRTRSEDLPKWENLFTQTFL